jgi:hypothetical protein
VAKQLILDANILMRAVLGTRVVALIRDYAPTVDFLTVDEAFEDVSTYLPQVLAKRGSEAAETQAALAKLRILQQIVQTIPTELFEELEPLARDRLKGRDDIAFDDKGLSAHTKKRPGLRPIRYELTDRLAAFGNDNRFSRLGDLIHEL